MKHSRSHHHGFTLIEVMIAIAIFAVLAVMAYGGLQSVIGSKSRTEAELDRLQQLQIAMLNLTGDLQQLSQRDSHDALGGELSRLTTQQSDSIVELTRSGWRNPADQPRSTLQRVAYRLDEDRLVRIYWRHLDRADDDDRVERVLINNIEELRLRFLDENNEWQEDWPKAEVLTADVPITLPRAVEITLVMGDWGTITRLIEVLQ